MRRLLTTVLVAALAAALAATWTAFADSGPGRGGDDDNGTDVRQEDRQDDVRREDRQDDRQVNQKDDRGDDHDRGHRGRGRGDDDDDDLFESALAPSDPADETLNGVAPGGVPWVLKRGEVELNDNGRLELKVRGLVIPNPPGDNTAGGVNTISASLFCGNSTTAADTSAQKPLSDAGNGRIKAKFDLPDTCLAPTVFVHPNGDVTRYIAVSGFKF